MEKSIKVHEKFLYEIWKKQNFSHELNTKDGQKIEVIDAGVENRELGGPDFKNARIKIGNITYQGDVEIDGFYSDWRNHGHSINKRFNSVILHAALNNNTNNSFVYTQDGRKVQSISLDSFLKTDLRKQVQQAFLSERKSRINKMRCTEVNKLLDDKKKLDYIHDLGVQRFKKKAEKMLQRMKEIIYLRELNLKEPVVRYELDEKFYEREFKCEDFNVPEVWEQLIYESIFEALGYSKNKEIMQKLTEAISIDFIKSNLDKENFAFYTEAALFNIAGLVPDTFDDKDEETSEYIRKLTECWVELKPKYDGKTFSSSQWHFFKLRPQNFPTIRLAGGAMLLQRILRENLILRIIKAIEATSDPKKLESKLRSMLIVKAEGFWKKHYVFDQPAKVPINYFIGVSRADEILINVILPILTIYFDIFNKKPLGHKVYKLYFHYYQKSENTLVHEVASGLHLHDAWKRSVLYQGMIELFRTNCAKNRCPECGIGKEVFN